MTRHLLAASLAVLVVTTTAAALRAEDWGTPGLDATHTRLSAERSGTLFGGGRWTVAPVGRGHTLASPIVADGYVVTAEIGGTVRALRAETGQPLWQWSAGSEVHGTPAVTHGRVFVPTLGNNVVALRLADGLVLWTRDVGGMVLSSPTPEGGDVLVAAGFPQRRIVRLSGATGEIVWTSPPIEQFSNTSPAVSDGLAIVGSNGGHYYAFELATGHLRWQYAGDGIVHLAAPLVAGGRVYMAGGDRSPRVHAVDVATGKAVSGWPVALPEPEVDIPGSRLGRQRAVSSFVSVGGLVVIQTRLDDAMDTDKDTFADRYLSREWVVGLDVLTGAVVWQHLLARAEGSDSNELPKYLVCPTPAAFRSSGGTPLLAAASSLTAAVDILDAVTGDWRGSHAVAGASLASPVVANGRLITIAMNGITQGLTSSTNRAPEAPIPAESARPLDAGDVTLRWMAASDPEGEVPSYELRIDADGELLESWQQQILLGAGQVSARITTPLQDGVRYSFAVRARDTLGALSSWSRTGSFVVVTNPPVTSGGVPVKSLAAAVGAAQPGEVIDLGPGTHTLTDTLRVPGGISIQGAGAGKTILDATGLTEGMTFDGASGGKPTGIDGVTLKGAATCLAVNGGATGIRLTHAIVRDCKTTGVAVRATGGLEIVNATLVGNGTAVNAEGGTKIRNSLVTNNGVGLLRTGDDRSALMSTFNDVFANGADYQGALAGVGDLSVAVGFADLAGRNLQVAGAQPSTDRGDPADAVGDEPAPNGGRINLGAFGGTVEAETSASSAAVAGGRSIASPTTDPKSGAQPPPHEIEDPAGDRGCAVANLGGRRLGWASIILIAAVLVRRRRKRTR